MPHTLIYSFLLYLRIPYQANVDKLPRIDFDSTAIYN